ncbi:MAG: RDD family protein [Bacteroidota bacterium]
MRVVGEGTRALNFFIDTLIIFAIAYFSFGGWNWYVMYWGYPQYNFGWFFFGILFVYYFLFEAIFGRTPGKWFTYSKVVNPQGKKAGIAAIFIRTLARLTLIDLFFIPFLGKPLHDYLSKTIVIEV